MIVNKYNVMLVKEKGASYPVNEIIGTPENVVKIIMPLYDGIDREQLSVLMLDIKNRIIGYNIVSIGVLSDCCIHPREIYKPAILANSASIILVHNHPSGDLEPSPEDLAATQNIIKAGEILGIKVLDHLIIGEDNDFYSMRKNGCMVIT